MSEVHIENIFENDTVSNHYNCFCWECEKDLLEGLLFSFNPYQLIFNGKGLGYNTELKCSECGHKNTMELTIDIDNLGMS